MVEELENSDVSEIHVHTEPSGDIYIERNFDHNEDDATLDEDPPAPPSPPHYHTQSSPSFVSDRELKRELSVASPRNNVSKHERIEEDPPAPPSPTSSQSSSFLSTREFKHDMSLASPRNKGMKDFEHVSNSSPRSRFAPRSPVIESQRRSQALRLLKKKKTLSRKKERSSRTVFEYDDDDDDDPPPPPPPPPQEESDTTSEIRVHTEPSGDIYIERNFDPVIENHHGQQANLLLKHQIKPSTFPSSFVTYRWDSNLRRKRIV